VVAAPGPGSPLPPEVSGRLGRGLGVDVSAVRVHTDTRASGAVGAVGARAFTWGTHVFLGQGEPATDLPLLAHEVTHAVQQSGGPAVHLFGGSHGDLEREAQRASAAVSRGETHAVRGRTSAATVQRQERSWWQRGLSAVTEAAGAVRERVMSFVKDKAKSIPGYEVLGFILGRDPITQQPVERTAVNLIRGVLKFVPGGDQMFDNLQESGVIRRAYEWFTAEITKLNLTWPYIRGLFQQAWDALSITDLASPSGAWNKLREVFGPPLRRIGEFALAAGRKVLEFVFEGALALAGGAAQQVLGFFRRVGVVFDLIVADPVRFLSNLVGAVVGGFRLFMSNIGQHLRTGVFEWLTGALRGAVTLPSRWDFAGILGLIMQVLGLTYSALRGVLVRLIGEPAVRFVEGAFVFLRTVVTRGLSAAWDKIKEFASGLVDTVIQGIRDWVARSVVGAAITRLATMFNPVGAIIQSIIAVYNTVMFFIERAQQIGRLLNSVVDSIENIARGNLGAAIGYVERTMANTLPVIIGFLGRLIGLGNVTEPVRKVIQRVQTVIAGALERVGRWIADRVRGLLGRRAQPETPTGSSGEGQVQVDFPLGSEQHHLRVRFQGGRAETIMASADWRRVPENFEFIRTMIAHWGRGTPDQRTMAAQLQNRLTQVENRLNNLQAQWAANPRQDLIRRGMNEVGGMIGDLSRAPFNLTRLRWINPVHRFRRTGVTSHRRTRSIEAQLCMDSWREGSVASLDGLAGIRLLEGYQRGHLLARRLGGKGDTGENLTPISRTTNIEMRDYAEKCANDNLDARAPVSPSFEPTNVIRYTVTCIYPDSVEFNQWLIRVHEAPPGTFRLFYDLAMRNIVEKDQFERALGKSLTDSQYRTLRKQLALSFLASTLQIRMEVLQGRARVGGYYEVSNHR
jgi:hypothetical protein